MSAHPNRASAEIVERKGTYTVKIINEDGSIVRAHRDQNGRIRYDRPERVPRLMKREIVPAKFKEIDRIKFGIPTGSPS